MMSTFTGFSLLPEELQLMTCRSAFDIRDYTFTYTYSGEGRDCIGKPSEELAKAQNLATTCRKFWTLYEKLVKPNIRIEHHFHTVCDVTNWYNFHLKFSPLNLPCPEIHTNGFLEVSFPDLDEFRHAVLPDQKTYSDDFLDFAFTDLDGVRAVTFHQVHETAALLKHWDNAPEHAWCVECSEIFASATAYKDDMVVIRVPRAGYLTVNIHIRKQCLLRGVVDGDDYEKLNFRAIDVVKHICSLYSLKEDLIDQF